MLASNIATGRSSVRHMLAVAAHGAAACGDAEEAAQLLLQGAGLLPATGNKYQQQLPEAEPEQVSTFDNLELSATAVSSPGARSMPSLHGGGQQHASDRGTTPAVEHLAGALSNPPPHQTSSSGQHMSPGQHRMVHRAELIQLAAQAAGLR
jgi:hypothetical protein